MIKVADAIMGTGKSSAAITYMNEHPDRKYIYITPYLDEASRITQECRGLHFYEPQRKAEFKGSKTQHTLELVKEGRNVATTHQAFRSYTSELLDEIKSKHYTLIIDENVEVLEILNEDPDDVQMIIDAGYVKEVAAGRYRLVNDAYHGKTHQDLFRLLRSRDIIKTRDDKDVYFYWQLPPELITSFDDVYILTYLLEGQDIYYFMKLYDIEYSKTYISFDGEKYRFTDNEDEKYIPEYVYSIKDKVHVLENEKLNAIGENRYSLSAAWFRKKQNPELSKLKNNISNYFKNIRPTSIDNKMWGTFNEAMPKLKGKGYSNGFVNFNMKATNIYRNRDTLAYTINVFMNVGQKRFYERSGLDVDEDMFSLSVMVQWMWRSAIRDGKEIYIYMPSVRMRDLLFDWMESISTGGEYYDLHRMSV